MTLFRALPCVSICIFCALCSVVRAQSIDSLLVIEPAGVGGRSPVVTDAVEQLLVDGRFQPPVVGSKLSLADGTERIWKKIEPGADGGFQDRALRGGYAFASVEAEHGQVMLLEARGHRHVYVNGTPRGGDVYNLGITSLPVLIQEGTNSLLFKAGRGRLQAKLVPPPAPLFLRAEDQTRPDVIQGEQQTLYAGVILTNATLEWQRELSVTSINETGGMVSRRLAPLPPLSHRKIVVPVVPGQPKEDEEFGVVVVVARDPGDPLASIDLPLRVRKATEKHNRTLRSRIDGSVQYYGVTPPSREPGADPWALFLSLHGAGVEANGQANCYRQRDWGVLIAPTNRRPFGFDWEDWGRWDALEVLAEARRIFPTDPRRTYLTGHSMGGHGTWNLGAHFPDQFAAIAPSAGWRDFWSYGGAATWEEPDPIEALLSRAANGSRTLELERNYLHGGVYVLHGDEDRTVPVDQARFMRKRLAEFHPNWAYYERPGAGHWWGNECMDWPPLFEFLRNNVSPAPHEVLDLEFATVNPSISPSCYWLTVEAQQQSHVVSTVRVKLDLERRAITASTTNVRRMTLDLRAFAETPRSREEGSPPLLARDDVLTVELDGETLNAVPWPDADQLRLEWDTKWKLATSSSSKLTKKTERAGPFKDAFRNKMVFVFGTSGSAEEQAWAFAKARYDAETFWYRGNGSVDVLPDYGFDPAAKPERNVILYGNQSTNSAWQLVLPRCPIQVTKDRLEVGGRVLEGGDHACLFVYPRAGSDRASVGVVAGTGLAGMRATTQLPYFVSGVGYPDWTVFGADVYSKGSKGVVGTGFFGDGWELDPSQQAWRAAPVAPGDG